VSGGWLAATGLALWQAAVESNTAKPKQANVAFMISFGPLLAFFWSKLNCFVRSITS